MKKPIFAAIVLSAIIPASAALANYPNVIGKADQEGNLKTFIAAAKAAGLTETLNGTDKWTVFAPTDEAFAKLPAGTLERLMKPENKDELAKLLKKHIVPGQIFGSTWANAASEVKAAAGNSIKIDGNNFPFKVNDATMSEMNVFATNGKIHAIDKVLVN